MAASYGWSDLDADGFERMSQIFRFVAGFEAWIRAMAPNAGRPGWSNAAVRERRYHNREGLVRSLVHRSPTLAAFVDETPPAAAVMSAYAGGRTAPDRPKPNS